MAAVTGHSRVDGCWARWGRVSGPRFWLSAASVLPLTCLLGLRWPRCRLPSHVCHLGWAQLPQLGSAGITLPKPSLPWFLGLPHSPNIGLPQRGRGSGLGPETSPASLLPYPIGQSNQRPPLSRFKGTNYTEPQLVCELCVTNITQRQAPPAPSLEHLSYPTCLSNKASCPTP